MIGSKVLMGLNVNIESILTKDVINVDAPKVLEVLKIKDPI